MSERRRGRPSPYVPRPPMLCHNARQQRSERWALLIGRCSWDRCISCRGGVIGRTNGILRGDIGTTPFITKQINTRIKCMAFNVRVKLLPALSLIASRGGGVRLNTGTGIEPARFTARVAGLMRRRAS